MTEPPYVSEYQAGYIHKPGADGVVKVNRHYAGALWPMPDPYVPVADASSEERVTDPETGGMKGKKLATFSSIPSDVLWELAEHFGAGSQKYKDSECECAEIAALMLGTTPEDFVSVATCAIGNCDTRTTIADTTEESRPPSTKPLLLDLAVYAERQTKLGTSITTMHAVRLAKDLAASASEDPSAILATSALAFLNALAPSGRTKHLPGCLGGSGNWQRGYDWRLNVDALSRHLHLWLQGEDTDPETGSNHLIAVIWHAMVLRYFQIHKRGRDFR